MKLIYTIIAMFILTCATPSHAVYNDNIIGVLKLVSVYADSDNIYLALENQPTTHPTCNPGYFVISKTVPQERRNMLLTRLLSAYHSKENVKIGFDNAADCANGYMRVHRVG